MTKLVLEHWSSPLRHRKVRGEVLPPSALKARCFASAFMALITAPISDNTVNTQEAA